MSDFQQGASYSVEGLPNITITALSETDGYVYGVSRTVAQSDTLRQAVARLYRCTPSEIVFRGHNGLTPLVGGRYRIGFNVRRRAGALP